MFASLITTPTTAIMNGQAIVAACEKLSSELESIKSQSGAILGTVFKLKENVLSGHLTNEKRLSQLNDKLKALSDKTPDPLYQKLPSVAHDADAKKLVHHVVGILESVKKKIDHDLKDGKTDSKSFDSQLQSMYRGQYIIRLIHKAYE